MQKGDTPGRGRAKVWAQAVCSLIRTGYGALHIFFHINLRNCPTLLVFLCTVHIYLERGCLKTNKVVPSLHATEFSGSINALQELSVKESDAYLVNKPISGFIGFMVKIHSTIKTWNVLKVSGFTRWIILTCLRGLQIRNHINLSQENILMSRNSALNLI